MYLNAKHAINKFFSLKDKLFGSKGIPTAYIMSGSLDIAESDDDINEYVTLKLLLDKLITIDEYMISAMLASYFYTPYMIASTEYFKDQGIGFRGVRRLIRKGHIAFHIALDDADLIIKKGLNR